MKLDLHIHSVFSRDGTAAVEDIVARCRSLGLGGFAITDHNAIEGSLGSAGLARREGLVCIPGVEVSALEGHVLAYGVRELVPRGLSAAETVDRIRSMGGVAVAAHPKRFPSGMGLRVASEVRFNAVETLNGGSSRGGNMKAFRMAEARKLPQTGGSDAHTLPEIGKAWTIVEGASTDEEVLSAIRKGACSPGGRSRSAREGLVYSWEILVGWLGGGLSRL